MFLDHFAISSIHHPEITNDRMFISQIQDKKPINGFHHWRRDFRRAAQVGFVYFLTLLGMVVDLIRDFLNETQPRDVGEGYSMEICGRSGQADK